MTDRLSQTDWGKTALTLASHVNKTAEKIPTFVLMRHSHRENPKDLKKLMNAPLTPKGEEASREFGRHLVNTRHYKFHSSFVGRCQATAKNIIQGIQENGGSAEFLGMLPELTEFGIDPKRFQPAFEQYGLGFLDHWIDGEFSNIGLNPPVELAQKAFAKIQEKIDPGSMNFFVSHDFHTLLYLYYWTGIRATKQWIQYSEGFVIQLYPDYMKVFFQEKVMQVPYPEWWKPE